MTLTTKINQLARWLFEARRARVLAERNEETVKDQIKDIMKDSEDLETDSGTITWRTTKDSEVTDWKAVAIELSAPRKLIEKHTSIKAGVRRFCVPKKWDDEIECSLRPPSQK